MPGEALQDFKGFRSQILTFIYKGDVIYWTSNALRKELWKLHLRRSAGRLLIISEEVQIVRVSMRWQCRKGYAPP